MVCRVCHRRLTDPVSIKRGVGPICAQGMHDQFDLDLESDDIRIPGDPTVDGVILEERDGEYAMNVDHLVVDHSPTGMSWGYGGSGPADLALNILVAFDVPVDEARGMHQDFKWQFIATTPKQGGVISADVIRFWISERREGRV